MPSLEQITESIAPVLRSIGASVAVRNGAIVIRHHNYNDVIHLTAVSKIIQRYGASIIQFEHDSTMQQ